MTIFFSNFATAEGTIKTALRWLSIQASAKLLATVLSLPSQFFGNFSNDHSSRETRAGMEMTTTLWFSGFVLFRREPTFQIAPAYDAAA